MSTQKPGLNREQVAELYGDLRKAMGQMKKGAKPKAATSTADAAKQIAAELRKAMSRDTSPSEPDSSPSSDSNRYANVPPPMGQSGTMLAITFILVLGMARVTLSVMDAMGIGQVPTAQAAMMETRSSPGPFSKEEIHVLTSLDARRAELAERSKSMDEREQLLNVRDREFSVRASQIKELTDRLKSDREKNEKKRNAQTEQLANVYSSMGPQEAAQLLEQLDIEIALSVIEHMPEKKIGQILGLMNRERALTLTKMLSGRSM